MANHSKNTSSSKEQSSNLLSQQISSSYIFSTPIDGSTLKSKEL